MALTPTEEADMRAMLDEAKIRAVMERYFHAIDANDLPALASCFTPDARLELNANSPARSVIADPAAIAAHFDAAEIQRRERRRRGDAEPTSGQVAMRTHQLSHTCISINGDAGQADSFAIVHIIAGERMTVRGLRYTDEFVRTGKDWRIRSRTHRVQWQNVSLAAKA